MTNCAQCGQALGLTDTVCPDTNCGFAVDECINCGTVDPDVGNGQGCPNCSQQASAGGLLGGNGLLMGGLSFGGGFVAKETNQRIEDALSQMPSLADRNSDFLKSIGADPAKAALTRNQARKKIADLAQARQMGYVSIEFLGNSLGIDEIRVVDEIKCVTCKYSDLGDADYDDNPAPAGQKYCYNCEQFNPVTETSSMLSRKEADWVDWKRAWETLKNDYGNHFTVGGDAEYDEKMRAYLPHVESTEAPPPPTLSELITGMNIRIEDPQGNDYYANVVDKNPLDPTALPQLLNLKTMQPIAVTSEWRVVEVV